MDPASLFAGAALLSGVNYGLNSALQAQNDQRSRDAAYADYHYQSRLMTKQQANNIELAHLQNQMNTDAQTRAIQHQQDLWNRSVDLANTAHQREVADLRAAGLNPVLSTHANGAPMASAATVPTAHVSTGSSGLGSVHTTPAFQQLQNIGLADALFRAVSSAKQIELQDAQMEMINKQADHFGAQAMRERSDADLRNLQAMKLRGELPFQIADLTGRRVLQDLSITSAQQQLDKQRILMQLLQQQKDAGEFEKASRPGETMQWFHRSILPLFGPVTRGIHEGANGYLMYHLLK